MSSGLREGFIFGDNQQSDIFGYNDSTEPDLLEDAHRRIDHIERFLERFGYNAMDGVIGLPEGGRKSRRKKHHKKRKTRRRKTRRRKTRRRKTRRRKTRRRKTRRRKTRRKGAL